MRCTRFGKPKTTTESWQCSACAHARSGVKWFAMKRRVVIAGNVKKSLANRLARIGMTRLLDRYLTGGAR